MPHEELQRRYQSALKSLTTDEIVDSVSIPLYVNSLESISRDFPRHANLRRISTILARHPQEEYARMTTVIPRKSTMRIIMQISSS